MEVMVIFIDLSQSVAYLKMFLIVVHPMLLAAIYRDATVRALEIDVLRRLGARLGIDLAVGLGELPWAVAVVRAAGVLSYEGRTLADLGDGRVGEGVEEVVLLENRLRGDTTTGQILVGGKRCRAAGLGPGLGSNGRELA